jgi:branched-chain amino acid transport system substrate-binding protein
MLSGLAIHMHKAPLAFASLVLAFMPNVACSQPADGAKISDGVVKIGVLTDMSSVYSEGTGSGSLMAARMAAADFGGSISGKPIEVISGDHQNKPDIGSTIARTWYDLNKVDAIVDVPTSSVALAVQQITREKNRVLLMSGAGSSDLTGPACSPNGIQWTYDTYALSNVAGKALLMRGDDTWFFITADYAFGHALERDASNVVRSRGGKVLGAVHAPLNTQDFSSFLVQALASRAKVVALANAGGDTQNAVKQSHEFGLQSQGQKLLGMQMNVNDPHSLGLEATQGMLATEGFYWDMDDGTRAFSKRYYEKMNRMPNMIQAGVYSAVTHYLKAVEAAGTDEARTVIDRMKAIPIKDFFAKNGRIREDGRMVHDMYLMQVKEPRQSKGEWDIYTVLATVSADDAYRPIGEGGCPLVKRP